jgi:hypothetical protein
MKLNKNTKKIYLYYLDGGIYKSKKITNKIIYAVSFREFVDKWLLTQRQNPNIKGKSLLEVIAKDSGLGWIAITFRFGHEEYDLYKVCKFVRPCTFNQDFSYEVKAI